MDSHLNDESLQQGGADSASSASRSKLLQALELWREITGVDPNATRLTISSWALKETFTALQEAIDLDPSEITANLLLGYFLNTYLAEREVSLLTLLNDPKSVADRLAKPRALMELLGRPELVEARGVFIAAIAEALEGYGAAGREDVQQLLQTHDSIALLRRDALRGIEKLRVDQFLDGLPEAEGFRPIYNRVVHQWWNVQSMLAAATRMPSGVSLNLIRHPDGYQSYFCFVVRNGGNLFVLSDVPEYSHPLQGMMSRRPDRELDRRAARNWFPYDLLGVSYDEESGRLYIKQTEQRGLVAYQNAALPLKPIADLAPPELVWLSMMFDLIVEKFWRRGYKAAQLSYTAEMLQAQDALIEHARTANLPVPVYEAVGLPALRKADVAADAVSDDEVGAKCHEPNRWMEERYGHHVPDEALNLLAAPEQTFALDASTGEITKTSPGYLGLTDWQQERELGNRTEMAKLDATSFGSRERIEADRKFIARANFATHVGKLAAAEFTERKDEVKAWYADRVKANASTLLGWCGHDVLWVDEGLQASFTHFEGSVGGVRSMEVDGNSRGLQRKCRQFLRRLSLEESTWEQRYSAAGVVLGGTKGSKMLCLMNGTAASYWVGIYPANAAELALVAGCAVTELPDVLQHWNLLRTYTGNHILSRIDPMIWKAHNPWLKLKLSVLIPLSKRAVAQLAKVPLVTPALPRLINEGVGSNA